MKRVAILGSTGSIGRNVLEVIEHLRTYEVIGLAAGQRIDLLSRQIKKIRPQNRLGRQRRFGRTIEKGAGRLWCSCFPKDRFGH